MKGISTKHTKGAAPGVCLARKHHARLEAVRASPPQQRTGAESARCSADANAAAHAARWCRLQRAWHMEQARKPASPHAHTKDTAVGTKAPISSASAPRQGEGVVINRCLKQHMSRRKTEQHVRAGRISVNGTVRLATCACSHRFGRALVEHPAPQRAANVIAAMCSQCVAPSLACIATNFDAARTLQPRRVVPSPVCELLEPQAAT